MRPKKEIIPIEGVWTDDGGKSWNRICPHCLRTVNRKSLKNVNIAHETKKKCTCGCGWNKGLNIHNSETIRIQGEQTSIRLRNKFKNGYQIWNKGLTKDTSDIVSKNADKHRGFKHTLETKKKISDASKEHWKDPEYRELVIKNATIGIRNSYANGNRKTPINFDTQPELRVEEILIELGISYIKQFPIWSSYPRTYRYVRFYDFFLPTYNMVLEVHGDYWHGYGKLENELSKLQHQTRSNDLLKSINAANAGLEYQIIWEHDTKNKITLYEKISEILSTDNKFWIGSSNSSLPKLKKYKMDWGRS